MWYLDSTTIKILVYKVSLDLIYQPYIETLVNSVVNWWIGEFNEH